MKTICPRCEKEQQLDVPGCLDKDFSAHVKNNGGVHCLECVSEMSLIWQKKVLPSVMKGGEHA